MVECYEKAMIVQLDGKVLEKTGFSVSVYNNIITKMKNNTGAFRRRGITRYKIVLNKLKLGKRRRNNGRGGVLNL